MSTSEEEYYARSPYNRQIGDDPLHVLTARTYVVNNIQHVWDENAQHLVNFAAQSAAERIEHTLVAADTWEYTSSFGIFPVRFAQSTPSPLVVRIGGSTDTGTALFRIILSPANVQLEQRSAAYPHITSGNVTSATDAWVKDAVVEITSSSWSELDSFGLVTTENTDGGGRSMARWQTFRADLWSRSSSLGAKNYWTGLMIREYTGT